MRRAFARAGLKVAPFKAQNVSTNAVVTPGVEKSAEPRPSQALTCGLEPSVDFNPILLNPGADKRSEPVEMATAADLAWLREQGLAGELRQPAAPGHMTRSIVDQAGSDMPVRVAGLENRNEPWIVGQWARREALFSHPSPWTPGE